VDAYIGCISVTVSKISTDISCILSKSEITEETSVTISGKLVPSIPDTVITLTYQRPDGSTFNQTVIIGSDGSYSVSYEPDAIGTWKVIASWGGDEIYQQITSDPKFFEVKKSSFFETPMGIAAIAGGIVAVITVSFILLRKKSAR
jgi:hypothetical protein